MIAWLVAATLAMPVQCDPDAASTVLREARIPEARAPRSHPELVPGLARASTGSSRALRETLSALCDGEGSDLSVVVGESWQDASHAAHTILLTRTETEGCSLRDRTVAVSVGAGPGGLRYDLRAAGTREASTPLGACEDPARWTEERVLGGDRAAERLVLVSQHSGDDVVASQVVARRAGPLGWKDQVLIDPAPPRLLDEGAEGPTVLMTETGERWIVETQGRAYTSEGCVAEHGQRVWRPGEASWQLAEGEEALALLASRGLWRYAGSDGWVAVIAQDDAEDAILLDARVKRLVRRNGVDLLTIQSASFPGLNPGFAVAVLGPFASEEAARLALRAFRGGGRRYVKRAWVGVDPCEAR